MYGWIIVFLQLVLEKDSTVHRIRQTLVLPIFVAYGCMPIISITIINIEVLMFCYTDININNIIIITILFMLVHFSPAI